MNTIEAAISGAYVLFGAAGLVIAAFVPRLVAIGERAFHLSGGAALACVLAWHRPFGDPLLILALSLFSFGAPIALAYGFHARRNAPDRTFAWVGLVLGLIDFGLFVCWMIASVLNFGVATGLWG